MHKKRRGEEEEQGGNYLEKILLFPVTHLFHQCQSHSRNLDSLSFPLSPTFPTSKRTQIIKKFSLDGKQHFLRSWQKSSPGTTAPLIQ